MGEIVHSILKMPINLHKNGKNTEILKSDKRIINRHRLRK